MTGLPAVRTPPLALAGIAFLSFYRQRAWLVGVHGQAQHLPHTVRKLLWGVRQQRLLHQQQHDAQGRGCQDAKAV